MDKELWQKAVDFHGHACPGLAMGFRAVEGAKDRLHLGSSSDEEIVCVSENDACCVDAIQALLSCTVGKGNLIFKETGKMAFSFFNRNNGEKIRLVLKIQNSNLPKEKFMEQILKAPLNEIFDFKTPNFDLPQKAQIFNTIICEICGEGAPEHKIRLQNGKKVCLDCFKDYSRTIKF
ncbi:MAG: FmdE family protein [Clostridiales bacterium]